MLILSLQACNNNADSVKSIEGSFYRQIKNSFTEMEANQAGYVVQPDTVAFIHIAVDPSTGYLIAANRENHSIHLFTPAGDSLLDMIGREGRGPAEFLSVRQLHFGHDSALYVLDANLKRITKFKIENGEFQYITSYTIEPNSSFVVEDIYVTKYGNYGVFKQIDYSANWKESFHLFKLNNQFSPVSQLLEIPGREKVKLSEHFYINNDVGRATYWDLNGQWFYYISSQSSQVNMYNIYTGQLKKKKYFNLEERKKTQKSKDFLKYFYGDLIKMYPVVADAFEEKEILPMFDNFQVENNHMLFDIFYTGGESGMIIYVNHATDNVKYIKTSSAFGRFALGEDILYGIETLKDKGPRIRILRLPNSNGQKENFIEWFKK